MLGTELGNFLQLPVRNVGLDLEVDPDPLASWANVFVESEESVQVNIPFEEGFHFLNLNSSRG